MFSDIDPWCVYQTEFNQELLEDTESIFSLGNGYLGLRGNFEQGSPVYQNGTYVNGFYEYRPIHYGEEAYGYAKKSQTILNLTDCKIIKLSINGDSLDLLNSRLSRYRRTLNMSDGTLQTDFVWHTPSGIDVRISAIRFVSLHRKELAVIRYQVTPINGKASVTLSSEMISNESNQLNEWDPREAAQLYGQVLIPETNYNVSSTKNNHANSLIISNLSLSLKPIVGFVEYMQ